MPIFDRSVSFFPKGWFGNDGWGVEKVKDIAKELIALYAKRKLQPSFDVSTKENGFEK